VRARQGIFNTPKTCMKRRLRTLLHRPASAWASTKSMGRYADGVACMCSLFCAVDSGTMVNLLSLRFPCMYQTIVRRELLCRRSSPVLAEKGLEVTIESWRDHVYHVRVLTISKNWSVLLSSQIDRCHMLYPLTTGRHRQNIRPSSMTT